MENTQTISRTGLVTYTDEITIPWKHKTTPEEWTINYT